METFAQCVDNSWVRELRCDPDAESHAPNQSPRQAHGLRGSSAVK